MNSISMTLGLKRIRVVGVAQPLSLRCFRCPHHHQVPYPLPLSGREGGIRAVPIGQGWDEAAPPVQPSVVAQVELHGRRNPWKPLLWFGKVSFYKIQIYL